MAGNGQTVCRNEKFNICGRHLTERRCPFQRVPLHLLGIPAVGEVPYELITSRDHPILRYPRPRVVIGFAQRVVESKFNSTNFGRHRVAVLDRWIQSSLGHKRFVVARPVEGRHG